MWLMTSLCSAALFNGLLVGGFVISLLKIITQRKAYILSLQKFKKIIFCKFFIIIVDWYQIFLVPQLPRYPTTEQLCNLRVMHLTYGINVYDLVCYC